MSRREYNAAYRAANLDRLREANNAYNAANREKRRLAAAARYAAKREDLLAAQAAYYRAHRNERLAYGAARYAADPGKAAAEMRAYRKAHPEIPRAHSSRRRVRKAGNGGSHTVEEWLARVEQYAGRCAYCGGAKPLTRDHDVPLSRGGTDFIENILPACQSCNSRKNTRTAEEFRVWRTSLGDRS